MSKKDFNSTLIPLTEAARRGYGDYRKLHRWTAEGKLPCQRVGNRILVAIEDLDELAPVKVSSDVDRWVQDVVSAAPSLSEQQRQLISCVLHADAGVIHCA